ncbi:sortase [Enterococcus sp. BWM-S5]|uniref:Sortase n=1 Tax=Enterococcus larvae TaxID=2794352 RepID=A0ABS4CF41_9ENTE|nr:sortase [Enterococcus larvae]MBP1045256.1 sortase [Enterococcus larvae]
MKANGLKFVIALALLTVAGGTTYAEIRHQSADDQITETTTETSDEDTTAPIISADNVTVTVGQKVNVLDGVTAKDDQDGDISARIVADKSLDTSAAGKQIVHYSATDNSGNIGWIDRTYTIVKPKAEKKAEAVADSAEKEAAVQEASAIEETPVTDEAAVVEAAPTAEAASETTTVTNTIDGAAAAPQEPSAPAHQAMTMYINGAAIPYQNGGSAGQSIIDGNPNGTVSTWGGAAVQSGSDGLNTHFIGHNPGIFSAIFGLGGGSQIIVTDGAGNATTYTVSSVTTVDDYATEISTGNNIWDMVTGTGGGERITLQTCIDDTTNLIVFAYK